MAGSSRNWALVEMGELDAKLPKALGTSTYARFGDLGFLLLLLAATLMAWILGTKMTQRDTNYFFQLRDHCG